jgi:hypothetical protein
MEVTGRAVRHSIRPFLAREETMVDGKSRAPCPAGAKEAKPGCAAVREKDF